MQPARPQPRAPGSFSPLLPESPRPRPRRVESSSSDDTAPMPLRLQTRVPQQTSAQTGTPIYASFMSHGNSSTSSLQNFSRPNALSPAAAAARQVSQNHDQARGSSPLTLPPSLNAGTSSKSHHSRKHSQTAPGMFEPTLPSTSTSNLPHIAAMTAQPLAHRELSASQIAAQAAVMHHQNKEHQQIYQQMPPLHQDRPQQLHPQQVQQQHSHAPHAHQPYQQHSRQRSQTAPAYGPGQDEHPDAGSNNRRGSGGPTSPPVLSLTEASAPRDTGFPAGGGYSNGMVPTHSSAAQTAASIVFPRSGQSSPGLPAQVQTPQPPHPPPPPPPAVPERQVKAEKSKVKLFSRPKKIDTKGETREKPLPSPGKIGAALSSLQRGNFSTTSLDSTAQSFYSLGNSSTATIRAVETPSVEGREKEKKHHFLSRQKHKLKEKDERHLPLSSAWSNSRPTDPSAPSSLYNFNPPPSPGPSSTAFKSMSGLDLRHGGRALREKKKEERAEAAAESIHSQSNEWPGPGSFGSTPGGSSLYLHEPVDSGKLGLHSIALDDAWPYLKAKLLIVFEGEDLRLPIEDLNRVVTMHIQYCLARRSPNIIVEDVRELLSTGFGSLDQALRKTPEDKLIPALVELWVFTFTTILPYMQAVFLPLDLEFSGVGSLMSADQARDFWGGVLSRPSLEGSTSTGSWAAGSGGGGGHGTVNLSPASAVLDVRRLVLTSFRDKVILPRHETLKTMFSRLSLEFLPQSLATMAMASPLPISTKDSGLSSHSIFSSSPSGDSAGSLSLNSVSQTHRPGTAMSLDPSLASYNSTGSTLLGDGSGGSRSRAISNVSYGSDGAPGSLLRPFTPSSLQVLGGGASAPAVPGGGMAGSFGSLREQNVEDSKQVTEMVGRMLQCMSVLSSIGVVGDSSDEDTRVAELCRLLKLNWLGRGRTGRNRRGLVGGRVRRGEGAGGPTAAATVREEVSVL